MTTYVGSEHDEYPYSAVVYITAAYSGGRIYSGSGVVVGRNDVLTASHLIYHAEQGGLAEEITVYPGLDGYERPFGSYEAEEAYYTEIDPDGDGLISLSESERDLALLGFDEAFGEATGWFDLDDAVSSGYYHLSGYPVEAGVETAPRMTSDEGLASKLENRDVLSFETIAAAPGNSGGPLWHATASGPSVAGVVSTDMWAADVGGSYDQIAGWIGANDSLLDNSAPVCSNDSAEISPGEQVLIDVLANDRDPDGDNLHLLSIEPPVYGEAQIKGDSIVYTPETGFTGTDRLIYTASDGSGAEDTAAVTIKVKADEAVPEDDYKPDGVDTPASMEANAFLTGALEVEGDRDWVALRLQDGVDYTISLSGQSLTDPKLYFVNARGETVAADDNGGSGLDAQLAYAPGKTGTFYAVAASAQDAQSGSYALQLTGAEDARDLAQQVYVGFYGRPADPEGLQYWAGRIDTAGGRIGPLLDAFASSPEAEAYVFENPETGEHYSSEALVNNIYKNLFERKAEHAGLEFYTDHLIRGEFTLQRIVKNVIDGARGNDILTVGNKLDVAAHFTDYMAEAADSSADIQEGRDILDGVDHNISSVTAAKNQTESVELLGVSGVLEEPACSGWDFEPI